MSHRRRTTKYGLLLALVSLLAYFGCAQQREPRSYVQANALEKDLFQGQWLFMQTVIDGGTFKSFEVPGWASGDIANGYMSAFEVEWVIDENYLYAYKLQKEIKNATTEEVANVPGYKIYGPPAAVFKIDKHFDIMRQYNPTTGEEINVVEENDRDRVWYEREYFRVDWSQNLEDDFLYMMSYIYQDLGLLHAQPYPYYVQDPNDVNAPLFATEVDPETGEEMVTYFDFVTKTTVSSGMFLQAMNGMYYPCNMFMDVPCEPMEVQFRNSFRRMDPDNDYEPLLHSDKAFERYGYFRNERDEYDWKYGLTDISRAQNFNINRFNIWEKSQNFYCVQEEETCGDASATKDCSAGYTCEDGLCVLEADDAKVECSSKMPCEYGHICQGFSIPFAERTVRQVVYYTSSHFRESLWPTVQLLAADWDGAFRATVRDLTGRPDCSRCTDDSQCSEEGATCQDQLLDWDDKNELKIVENSGYCVPEDRKSCVFPVFVARQNICNLANIQSLLDEDSPSYDPIYADLGIDARTVDDANKNEVCSVMWRKGFRFQREADRRYNFFNFVRNPYAGMPLGLAQMLVAPYTGEVVQATANVYDAGMQSAMTRAMEYFDLYLGNLTEDDIVSGESVREYMQNVGASYTTPVPQPENFTSWDDVRARLDRVKPKLDRIVTDLSREQAAMFKKSLRDTPLEALLIAPELEDSLGNDSQDLGKFYSAPSGTATMDLISPVRHFDPDNLKKNWEMEQRKGMICLMENSMFIDYTVDKMVEGFKNKFCANNGLDNTAVEGQEHTACEIELARDDAKMDELRDYIFTRVERDLFRAILEHEVGHTLGLRHNFQGSFDRESFGHFSPHTDSWNNGYYQIEKEAEDEVKALYPNVDSNNVPDRSDYLTFSEWYDAIADYDEARATKMRLRDLKGWREYAYSSIMDYSQMYFYDDVVGIGRYDFNAIKFGYGQLVDRYTCTNENCTMACTATDIEDCTNRDGVPINGRANQDYSNRYSVRWYEGGEGCKKHQDCPAFDNGQRCEASDPETGNIGSAPAIILKYTALHGSEPVALKEKLDSIKGRCTNFEDDAKRLDMDVPIEMFCSDERAEDRPFCNRWDKGISSQEIVDYTIDIYEKSYPWNNFRRYRRDFGYGYDSRIFSRYFKTIADQFQSLYWHLYYEPGFEENTGPGGFMDMWLASVKGMNFFARVLGTPDVATYGYFPSENLYRRCWSTDPYCPQDLDIPMGVGKYYYFNNESGYYGETDRTSRIGHFMDKYYAFAALGLRDWGLPYANGERFFLNYYDVFDREMLSVFGGIMSEDFTKYAPSFDPVSGEVKYRDLWYGEMYIGDERDPFAENENLPSLQASGSTYPQIYALLWYLQEFPIFFDTSAMNSILVWVQGEGIGRTPTYNGQEISCGDENIICYESPFNHKTYMAMQDQELTSITWNILEQANYWKAVLEAGEPYPDERYEWEVESEIQGRETFLDMIRSFLDHVDYTYGWF